MSADVLLRLKVNYRERGVDNPIFIVDSNILCKELLFTHASNLAQKPFY